jgi:TonB family protein
LAIMALLAALGLLRREPDTADARPASHPESRQPAPAGSGAYRPVAGSRDKPSPAAARQQAGTAAPGRQQADPAAPAKVSPANPITTTSQPVAGAVVLLKVFPLVPQKARETIQGTVRVGIKVQVDSFGNVVGSEVDSPGPSRYFAQLAAQAAQGWKFAPSNRDAGRDFILQFDFTNTETRASATLVNN